MTRASCPARCSHWGLGGSRSLGLRHRPKFGRRCALFLIIVESCDKHVSSEDLREQAIHVPASGAPTDSLGRARGDGWDAAGGPVPRAETRVPCLFKQISSTRGEHVAWEDPRPRGTRLVAPRPPAFSLRAPPVVKQEVSLHPRPRTRAAKVRVSALLHGTGGRFHTSAYFRPRWPPRPGPLTLVGRFGPVALVTHLGNWSRIRLT